MRIHFKGFLTDLEGLTKTERFLADSELNAPARGYHGSWKAGFFEMDKLQAADSNSFGFSLGHDSQYFEKDSYRNLIGFLKKLGDQNGVTPLSISIADVTEQTLGRLVELEQSSDNIAALIREEGRSNGQRNSGKKWLKVETSRSSTGREQVYSAHIKLRDDIGQDFYGKVLNTLIQAHPNYEEFLGRDLVKNPLSYMQIPIDAPVGNIGVMAASGYGGVAIVSGITDSKRDWQDMQDVLNNLEEKGISNYVIDLSGVNERIRLSWLANLETEFGSGREGSRRYLVGDMEFNDDPFSQYASRMAVPSIDMGVRLLADYGGQMHPEAEQLTLAKINPNKANEMGSNRFNWKAYRFEKAVQAPSE